MRTFVLTAFVIVIFAFGILSCKDTITGSDQIPEFPPANVSYSQHVQPLLNLRCAFSGCHGADTYQQLGWDLTAHGKFVISGQDIVVPGDPDLSRLNRAIEGRTPGREMPRGSFPLPENAITGMRRWVLEGALHN